VPGVDGEVLIHWWYRQGKKNLIYGMMAGGVEGWELNCWVDKFDFSRTKSYSGCLAYVEFLNGA